MASHFPIKLKINILCIYSRKMNSIQILSSDFICSLKQSRHIPVTWKISIYRCETTFFHLLTNLELFQKMNCCLLYDGYRYKPRGMGMYGVKRTGSIFTHNWLRTVYNEKEPASLLSCSPGDSSDNSNSKHVCASCIFQPFANFTTFISSKIRTHFYLK